MQTATPKKTAEEDLAKLYLAVRNFTQKLCEPLETEDYIPQPIVDVSPSKWNIAHTTWFFEEMILRSSLPGYKVFDPDFGFLFNSYYNTIGDRTARDHRGDLSRPTVKKVFQYRKYVDEHMIQLLSAPRSAASGSSHPAERKNLTDLVVLGLNHEQQHQELFLTDLKYTFSVNPLFPAYREDHAPEELSQLPASASGQFIDIEKGIFDIGHIGSGFCFDNELARHKVYLESFAIADRLVTNAEFLEFINDGGYKDHRLWHSEGWDWVNNENVASPLYWHDREGEWHHFTLGGLRKLPMDAPVCHVSLYEASAFAEWKGCRLPTEFEWEAANGKFDWGLRWEWTNSAYLPYPGFLKPDGAVGEYNGKFMVNQMVLRGASVATPEGHSRPTYRNFFHPHLRWQFTGIRLARG
ncbi:MAG TPA: ergothioneine biosynthesis protein EgtB [Pyrinomonadaceae bacterium]|nr:ergothioneine biosynthesis protein EgtB [Pyrinomonadaceae bacterium]